VRLRSDLREFSLAIEQPLARWQADSLAFTTVVWAAAVVTLAVAHVRF